MKRHFVGIATVIALLAVATACGSGSAPATTAVRTDAPSATTPLATDQAPGPGEPTAEGLCAAFTEALALAALGQAAAEPTSGDVLPRPNGVYCHYAAAADGNVNAEAQLKNMTREEFESLADTLGMTESLPGVGEAAFQLDRSLLGGGGATVAAWSNGRGVTVIINNESADSDAALAAAAAIAAAALGS